MVRDGIFFAVRGVCPILFLDADGHFESKRLGVEEGVVEYKNEVIDRYYEWNRAETKDVPVSFPLPGK